MSGYFFQNFLATPDGAELFHEVRGEGDPAMVLCDGLGCDGFIWKYVIPEFKRDHRMLRWHYRGHGKSGLPRDRDRIGMSYNCEDLDRVMASVGIAQGVVLGHSMGVQVALEFHRRYPHRVNGLILICGSYGNPLDTFHDATLLRRAFPYIRQVVDRFPQGARRLTKWALSTELAVRIALELELNKELIRRADVLPYFDHLANMDPQVFVRTLDSLAEHSGWAHLPHIDVPTLVIGGEKDTFTPLWLSRRMADAIPGSEIMIVPGGTHTALIEQPSMVAERIHRFLDKRVAPYVRARAAQAAQATRSTKPPPSGERPTGS